jgi:hypothetical protein
MAVSVTPWVKMSMAIVSVMIIANGVVSPIRMTSFPSMETIEPEWVTDQPDVTKSQIEILVPNETNIFVTIPDVTIRNHYWSRCFSHNYWCRCNHHWCERHPPIWLNYTT